jgi:hypothetical protein
MANGFVGLIYALLSMFAIYLSFQCNGGFKFWGFLGALFFPFIYIPYKLGTSKDMCGFKKVDTGYSYPPDFYSK